MRRFLPILAIGIVSLAFFFVKPTSAQGCAISEFTMSPSPPYTLGTHVQLYVKSSCGTVRFEINGQPKAEIGSSEQNETWKTEEFGSGTHTVCAVARGDGGWENADRECRDVYVEGGQAPPEGSESGGNARCWVNSFVVTPGSGPVGTSFNLSSQGQCDGNMRAARYTIDGKAFGEHTSNTHNTDWNSSGYSTGNHTVCFLVTGGDWSEAAKSCVNVTLKKSGSASNDVAEGEQATNNQPGQTYQSNPSDVDNPQGNSPEANNGNSNSCTGITLGLDIGDIARITPGLPNNLRAGAGESYNRIDRIPGEAEFIIVGGPSCAGGYWWWKVQYQGQVGWTAQGDGSDLWIEFVSGGVTGNSSGNPNNSIGDNANPSQIPTTTPKPTDLPNYDLEEAEEFAPSASLNDEYICYGGYGFGFRDGHHFVKFQVKRDLRDWFVTNLFFVPSGQLWANPDDSGYAEAGFRWPDWLPILLSPSFYQLCGYK